tara:strand:+ start:2211 stop:3425 length:1215 start_codon:yes stop_codon:yes gene_type:complete
MQSQPMPIEEFNITNLNADYLQAWLEDDIDSIDEKVLYDLQTLIKHYSNIIVPEKNVSISYPTSLDASACADTDNNEVFIPTSTLLKGELDHTIGLMIHELQHLKLSLKGSVISEICYYMVNQVLKSTFVGNDDDGWESLFEVIQTHQHTTFKSLREIYSGEREDSDISQVEQFYLTAIKGLAMLLNCVEDVRIDSLTQPNLKKYIDKGDNLHAPVFIEKYNKGDFDERNIENTGYKFLFHHKGFLKDDYIDMKYPNLDELLESQPLQYIPIIFDKFKDEITKHVRDCYKDFQLPDKGDISGNLDEVLGSEHESEDSDYNLSQGIQISEEEYNPSEKSLEETRPMSVKEFIENYTPDFVPITSTLVDRIDVMGKIKIHTTEEEFEPNSDENSIDTYSCVIYDDC